MLSISNANVSNVIKKISLWGTIAVGVFYLCFSLQYRMPWGDDGIIYMWPAGFWLAKVPWHEGWKVLISSFLTEDHLSPVHYLLGYLFYLLPLDPVWSMNIAAKVFYLMYVALSLRAIYEIWEDKNRVLLFFAFLVVNLSMTWRTMVIPAFFSVAAAVIWAAFIFYLRYLKRKTQMDFILFSILFLLATFSFETAFVGFPLFLVFALLYSRDGRLDWGTGIQRVVKHGLWLGCLFLPYLLVHFYVYGGILPKSRLDIFVDGSPLSYCLRILFSTFSEWCFDVPKALIRGVVGFKKWENSTSSNVGLPPEFLMGAGLAIFVVISLGVLALAWGIIRFKFIRDKGWILWTALAVQTGLILITGRYEDGMWIIGGLTFWMAVTDIVYYFIKKEARIPVVILGILVSGIVVNIFVNPFDQARQRYQNAFEAVRAAYMAVNENTDRIKIIRLNGSDALIHSSTFWIGNKIYHREPGLWFHPQQLLLYPRNMHMDFYPNVQNHSFDFFRAYIDISPANTETLLFQDSTSFFRIYLDANQNKIVRVVPIATSDKELSVEIRLPDLTLYNFRSQRLRYVLNFTEIGNIQKIYYEGSPINNWRLDSQHQVEFYDTSMVGGNLLVQGEGMRLNEIEVFIDGELDLKKNQPADLTVTTLLSEKYMCVYSASSTDEDWIVWGTTDPQRPVRLSPLFMQKFRLDSQRVHPNRSFRQKSGKEMNPQADKALHIVNICDATL